MYIKTDDPLVLCEWASELGTTHAFLDLHVHPYDVLSGDIRYKPDSQAKGLFTRGFFNYHPPVMENGINGLQEKPQLVPDSQRAFILASRYTYNQTGPKVFEDQMELVHISGALLLPVARTAGKAEEMLVVTHEMFKTDNRLLPGCAFPIGVQPKELAVFFQSAFKTYGIRAIKLHPNLAGIDPITQAGQDSICATLAVASELHLPILVHGGRTPSIEMAEGREFGAISRLSMIDWSISIAPVILAHAGCYGLSYAESVEALIILSKLLEKHSNLMVDISNLEPPILRLVLEKVNHERIVFGSDALYVPVWKAWIKFLQILQLVSKNPEDDLIRMASLNPARCLSI
jgi:predicted TIM-barrel fold metal-dependent hydrolase